MAQKINPINGWIHVQPEKKETVTKGGIIIPEPSQKRSPKGTVLAAGLNVEEVKEGDSVLYLQNTGLEQEDGTLLLKIENVLAKLG